jgi:hypothetical protein
MSVQTHSTKRGMTLRHWTTDSAWFGGGQQRPSPALALWDLAAGRRLNLVASMLRLVRTRPTTPIEA